ncbi:MAG: helix-turn-helix domain-containing protein [Planctomycetota bacterium]|nr:helix-turn-helix domain-containing protein [Planctomycetota bacterium]
MPKISLRNSFDGDPSAFRRLVIDAHIDVDSVQHWRSDEQRIVLNPIKPYDFVLVPLVGSLALRIGSRRLRLEPGHCLALSAGVEHHGQLAPGCATLEACTIHSRMAAPGAPRLFDHYPGILPCSATWRHQLCRASALKDTEASAAHRWTRRLLRELLIQAWDAGLRPEASTSRALFDQARAAIDAHPELTIAAIADSCGCTPGRLRQLFSDEMGIGPGDYRARERLRRACRLLRAGGDISTVATRSGFGTTRALQLAFRRHLATTPQEYRAGDGE